MNNINMFEIKFCAVADNEAFARHVVGEFLLLANPTIEELEDVKTAVTEAVTNAIVHGYDGKEGLVTLCCSINDKSLEIIVSDNGRGIENVELAKEPFYTTRQDDDHSGMGFTLMSSFMDSLDVRSNVGNGTTVIMTKIFSQEEDNARAQ